MSTLDDVREELADYEGSSERALQIESGASQAFGCRAESVFRLTGYAPTDPHLSWEAVVGKALHRTLAEAGERAGKTVEQRYTYRNVAATIDRYDKGSRTLTDYKSKGALGDIAKIMREGPPRRTVAQLHVGAAALIEAGYQVDTVEALYVPRDGSLDDAYLWSAPFDRGLADEAVDWLLTEAERAENVAAVTEANDITLTEVINGEIDGLRDEPLIFCRNYCPFVTACRGPAPEVPELDDDAANAAAEHHAADLMEKEGKARKARVRGALLGLRGRAGEFEIVTSGGREKREAVEDLDELRATYRFIHGEEVPLPTRTEVTTTTVRLIVKPAKAKS